MRDPDRTDDGDRGRPDVARIAELDRDERAKLVKRRRWMRRVKAVAAIGLAIAAGTFMACAGRQTGPTTTPDADDMDAANDGGDMDGGTMPADAGTPMDAPTVDAMEYRDGMPVPDNLLE